MHLGFKKDSKVIRNPDQERLYGLIKNSSDVLAIADNRGILQYVSPIANKFFGWSARDYRHAVPFERVHPDDLEKVRPAYRKVLSQIGSIVSVEIRIKHGNGSWIFCEVTAQNCFDDPSIRGILLYFKDITKIKRIEDELKNNEERLRALMEISSDVVLITDQSGIIQYLSDAVQRVLGYAPEECIGKNISENIHPEDVPWVQEQYRRLLMKPGASETVEIRISNARNEWGLFEVIARNFCHESRINGIVLMFHDISGKRQVQRRVSPSSHEHELIATLPNRQVFQELVEACLCEASPENRKMALLSVDLDRFAQINAAFSQAVGDQSLELVARRLKELMGYHDILARVNGSAFGILVTEISDARDVTDLADGILLAFKRPFELHGSEIHISATIGVSMYPDDGLDALSLMKNADTALHVAREKGRTQYQFFHTTMNIKAHRNFVIQNDLYKAIKQNELALVYQPRVEPTTGRIVGAEALVRWEHPEWGAISPMDFIPVSEQMGLIISLGEWVLRNVCAQIKLWESKGIHNVPISINCSALQFEEKDAAKSIVAILSEYEVPSDLLEIEMTESALALHEDTLNEAFRTLRQFGIRTSIDDFGTGYSSLNRLSNLELNTLKIDRSFIQHIDSNVHNATITRSIIQMAKGLGLTVVAEGVESKEELAFLVQEPCDQIQGFLFSPPVTPRDFEGMLQQERLTIQRHERQTENRRGYFRVDLPLPLAASVTIVKLREKNVSLGSTSILIENFGADGLKFISPMRFPVNPHIVLRLSTTIFEELTLDGRVVWVNERESGLYEYGIEFFIDEDERVNLIRTLNQFTSLFTSEPTTALSQCQFHRGDVAWFFKTTD